MSWNTAAAYYLHATSKMALPCFDAQSHALALRRRRALGTSLVLHRRVLLGLPR